MNFKEPESNEVYFTRTVIIYSCYLEIFYTDKYLFENVYILMYLTIIVLIILKTYSVILYILHELSVHL